MGALAQELFSPGDYLGAGAAVVVLLTVFRLFLSDKIMRTSDHVRLVAVLERHIAEAGERLERKEAECREWKELALTGLAASREATEVAKRVVRPARRRAS